MKEVEKFIQDYTRNCSNEIGYCHNKTRNHNHVFYPWLTPDHARKVAEIAREETIKEVCEWLDNHNDYICGSTNGIARYDMDKLIEDLKKHLESKA